MERQEDPRALLRKMTSENLAKMREITERIAKLDERAKGSKETKSNERPYLVKQKIRDRGKSDEGNA